MGAKPGKEKKLCTDVNINSSHKEGGTHIENKGIIGNIATGDNHSGHMTASVGEQPGKRPKQYVHRVYIWLPRQNFQIGGHVSLLLNDGTYISWWPRHGKDFKKAKVFTLHGIEPSNGTSLEEDIRSMEYSYNHEFEIPSERLDLQRMKDFWESVLTTRNFDPKKENCCWVVYNVLLAGGAPPASVWSPWRPGMIRRYMVNFVGDGSPIFRLIGNFLPF